MIRRRPLLAAVMTVAVLWLCAAPGAHAAKPVDPVRSSIDSALASKQITPAAAKRLRSVWAQSARAATRAPSPSRRASVVAVRAYTINLARRGALRPDRLEPALLSVKATTYVMTKVSRFPSHEAELQIPGEIVVFTYYAGRGVQYQPFESFKLGMRYINQLAPDVAKAQALADRMLELSQTRGTSRIWEYFFVFGGPSLPWTSAISQALGTEFFYRVATLVPAEQRAPYDDAARRMTNSFLRSTRAGGVGTPEGSGRYYTMYPFNPSQRILNGHLQVILNLNRYATATGSTTARQVVDLGLAALMPLLPKFDTGAWSRYQLGQEADLNYHDFQTDQLVKLGKELKNETLRDYGDLFGTYRYTPPVVSVPATSWPSIIPAQDGYRDTIAIRYRVDKRSSVSLVVLNANGTEVRRLGTTTGGGQWGTLVWNGRNTKGVIVPDGSYTARLTATDIAANRASGELTGTLDVARDTEAPVLTSSSLAAYGSNGSTVTVRASDLGSAWVDVLVKRGSTVLASRRGPRAGTTRIRISKPVAAVRGATLVLRDSSGNVLTQPIAG